MKNFFAVIFASIISFFTGNQPAPSPTIAPSPSPISSSPSISPSPSASPTAQPKPTRKPTSSPSATTHPTVSSTSSAPTPSDVPKASPGPSLGPINTFVPMNRSGKFHVGMGECSNAPAGSYQFETTSYDTQSNITGVKIHVTASGLLPNTQYILNVGSKSPLGGPSVTTDGSGSLDYSVSNIAYTVGFDAIYSLSLDDPAKIYPNNSCLAADLLGGQG